MKKPLLSGQAVILLATICFFLNIPGTATGFSIRTGNEDMSGPADTRWGDLGDGTYANPVLNADYSDPDVIRVGDKYYMTCSEFHFMGMPVLESEDMVNWRIIGQVYDRLDMPGYSDMKQYAGGTWAPALRYHDGRFIIFVCTPKEGLFMTTATDPAGPWAPLHEVRHVAKWEDPCPFWDEDGKAYLARSRHGAGPIIIHRMSPDGRELTDDGVTVYTGPVAEGPKMMKKDGWYYISIPEGGVGRGWHTMLRSRDIYGPYEAKRVLERGSTDINGPHQGALVETPGGEWWFYHFQATGARGRVLHLQPVEWVDGWPVIGQDYDGNGVGEPVKVWTKPSVGLDTTPSLPASSDTFDGNIKALQWQFNHNPDTAFVSFDTPGTLTIIPRKASGLRNAKNQLTQKIMGFRSEATLTVDAGGLHPGDRAGLECIGKKFMGVGVMVSEAGTFVYTEDDGTVTWLAPVTSGTRVILRLDIDTVDNSFRFSYSTDGDSFKAAGGEFAMRDGFWKGCRTGIFSYTTGDNPGTAVFDGFTYRCDGPGGL